jgi:hypothetical protein
LVGWQRCTENAFVSVAVNVQIEKVAFSVRHFCFVIGMSLS